MFSSQVFMNVTVTVEFLKPLELNEHTGGLKSEAKPAHSDSISPADMLMGSIPIALNTSSVWKVFP
jgi:hypothetical protein